MENQCQIQFNLPNDTNNLYIITLKPYQKEQVEDVENYSDK